MADLSPLAPRLSPPGERCPDCGQPAVLRHKGRRLVRCAACSLAALRMRKQAYHVAHRAERRERRRNGGVPCPPYVAWDVEAWPHGVCVLYAAMAAGGLIPVATVMPGYGACSCGAVGCVHLVVACLWTESYRLWQRRETGVWYYDCAPWVKVEEQQGEGGSHE